MASGYFSRSRLLSRLSRLPGPSPGSVRRRNPCLLPDGESLSLFDKTPRSPSEQIAVTQKLEAALSEVDQLDQTLTASLQQAEALRQSILKKAFFGQLVAQDASDEPAAALLARIAAEKSARDNKPKTTRTRTWARCTNCSVRGWIA